MCRRSSLICGCASWVKKSSQTFKFIAPQKSPLAIQKRRWQEECYRCVSDGVGCISYLAGICIFPIIPDLLVGCAPSQYIGRGRRRGRKRVAPWAALDILSTYAVDETSPKASVSSLAAQPHEPRGHDVVTKIVGPENSSTVKHQGSYTVARGWVWETPSTSQEYRPPIHELSWRFWPNPV